MYNFIYNINSNQLQNDFEGSGLSIDSAQSILDEELRSRPYESDEAEEGAGEGEQQQQQQQQQQYVELNSSQDNDELFGV